MTALNDICELIVDCEHKTAPKSPTGFPSIRTPNVGRGRLILDNVNRVDEETYTQWTRRAVPKENDLIIAREAPVGNVAIIRKRERVCLGQRTVLVRPDPHKVNPEFLCYFMLGDYVQGQFGAAATGATVPHLNMRDIRGLQIPSLPTRAVQNRIASVLSAYDDLIENNTRRIEILEEIAGRLYEEWFVHFRFPGHEEVRFKESELGRIPEGWDVVTLETVCDRITDGAHKSPPKAEIGKPMASVKDMHNWGIDLSKCRTISEDDYVDLVRNNCKPLPGDVLIAKDGSYLKHSFVMEREVDLVLLSSIAILRPNNEIAPNLLALTLQHPDNVARMKGFVSGVAIPRIILKDFRKFKIILPPAHIQSSWASIADPMMTLCRRLIDKNANLRAQRDLLLPKLVSGEIDVSDIPVPDNKEVEAA